MKKFIGILLFTFCVVVSASAQKDLCFENDGLKSQHKVTLSISRNNVEGTFEVSGYEESTSAETFDFTGTRAGNLLTIKFAGKAPYQLPPGTKRIVWTLVRTTLKIPIYGKNYETNKYSVYTASYTKCKAE